MLIRSALRSGWILAVFLGLIGSFAHGAAPAPVDLAGLGRPAVRVFNDRDGLPQMIVDALAFDHEGYLWVGTTDGVVRYNGRAWESVELPNRSRSNWVIAIRATSDGSLWFGTRDGGLARRLKNGQWAVYDTTNGLPANRVRAVLETRRPDGTSSVWAGTSAGIARLDLGGEERWRVYDTTNGLPNDQVWVLRESRGEFASAGGDLRSLLAAGSFADAIRLAHTVKGVAGNIGAGRLQAAAAEVETALKRDERDVSGLVDKLEDAAVEVVNGLDRLEMPTPVSASAPAAPVDWERLEPVVRELEALLREDNFAAEACFERLADLLGDVHAQEIAHIRTAIDNLEYAAALEPLARIAAMRAVKP